MKTAMLEDDRLEPRIVNANGPPAGGVPDVFKYGVRAVIFQQVGSIASRREL
jgi:hypothetical protein